MDPVLTLGRLFNTKDLQRLNKLPVPSGELRGQFPAKMLDQSEDGTKRPGINHFPYSLRIKHHIWARKPVFKILFWQYPEIKN